MLGMLVAYDAEGAVVATLDYLAVRSADGEMVGLVDFSEVEASGAALADLWRVEGAAGSGSWPEWIGAQAHSFRVELEETFARAVPRGDRPDQRIRALVHKASGHRRERADVDQAIAARIVAAGHSPADVRDLVGGPDRPLAIDDEGSNRLPDPAVVAEIPVEDPAKPS